ncbi:MAG: nickel pincer cofactor biosynthesis protein LarC [Kofleriaceae bacterium]
MKGLHLHVDCASGAAGDMLLGALVDLGVPLEVVYIALDQIGAGRARLSATPVTKAGIAAIDIKVDTSGELAGAHRHEHAAHAPDGPGVPTGPHHVHEPVHRDGAGHVVPPLGAKAETWNLPPRPQKLSLHVHARAGGAQAHAYAQGDHAQARADVHTHAHGPNKQHAHYHYSDIRARIDGSALTEGTKRRALDIFDRLARAEAKLHGTTVDAVAFHEVGAVDSVVDIVGTAAALDWLSPSSVTCTGIAMGHGTLTCAHGVLPVPAPAALEVLREAGGICTDGGIARELCTPTGAAILAATVTAWTAAPAGVPVAIGWGAGDIDLPDRANVVRVTALQLAAQVADAVWQIDANLDDMSPELAGPAMDAIFAAGAVDAWWSPITMKKGRPAFTLSALAPAPARDAVIAAILRETTSIGVRYSPRERTVLARRTVEVATRYGAIAVKVAMGPTGETQNVAPEYEACAAAAKAHGVPVKLVYAATLAAFGDGS